ncbi:MAG: TRAP transporter large permease subunit [Parvibaculum sp.]
MGVEALTGILFLGLFGLIFLGVPLAFALGSVALVLGYFQWGPLSLHLISSQVKGAIFNYTLVSIPFFMFMANILSKSGIADDLYEAIHKLMGPLRGGLAMGTVLACALIAAMSGVSAVGVMAMGTIALPAMLARQYDKHMALGTVLAGGALGQLIPPSILAIVYSGLANISIGQVFLAGVMPGLLLVGLFVAYVGIRCYLNPGAGPALSAEERAAIGWRERIGSLAGVLPPILLVLSVLGTMFAGIASPTEAAAVGALGSVVLALLHRRLDRETLLDACYQTLKSTTMVLWIALASLLFVSVYAGIGGDDLVRGLLLDLELPGGAVVLIMMVVIFLLGTIMDPIGIVFLTTPIFVPIVEAMGFSSLWYGALLIINLEMAYLTPPFGYNLFYLRAVAPPGITMGDLYRSVPPFILLQMLGLSAAALFPEIVTWLPELAFGN